jgi:anti-sigma factor RsiW
VSGHDMHLGEELVQEYLDDALAIEDRERVDRHLAGCPRCASEMEAWQLLLSSLGELPAMGPMQGFAERVMAEVPTRPSLMRRFADRTRRALGRGAGSLTDHLSPEGLQDLLDGALGAGDRRRAEAHLARCSPCQDEFQRWEGVFARLSALEHMVPSDGFGDRVFKAWQAVRPSTLSPAGPGIRLFGDWTPGLAAAARRLVPESPRGWAAAAALVSIPMVPLIAVISAVFAHPLLSFEALASFVRWRAGDALLGLAGSVATELVSHPVTFWIWEGLGAAAAAPGLAMAALISGWAAAAVSAWILYRHLVVPSREARHHA